MSSIYGFVNGRSRITLLLAQLLGGFERAVRFRAAGSTFGGGIIVVVVVAVGVPLIGSIYLRGRR